MFTTTPTGTSKALRVKHLGVKERQDREREAVSRGILDAARELFVTDGYQHVSIRKIAERIEYSPAAIYGYFPSKDDIFFALAEEGFRLLFNSASAPADAGADPVDDLRADVLAVLRIQQEPPGVFRADVPGPDGAARSAAIGNGSASSAR